MNQLDPAILIVAPNGARRTKSDHPALPVTIPEVVAEAALAHGAGASVLHAHVRDATGGHCLDAGLYRELIGEMRVAVPDMLVQITTEAVGLYSPQAQAECLFSTRAEMASIALREMAPEDGLDHARSVYARAQAEGIHVQHILYDVADLERFLHLRDQGVVPQGPAALLFVLGRYAGDGLARAEELDAFRAVALAPGDGWSLCAFGPAEGACVAAALAAGGHARVGFENNFLRADGSLAAHNADLVSEAAEAARTCGRAVASAEKARSLLIAG